MGILERLNKKRLEREGKSGVVSTARFPGMSLTGTKEESLRLFGFDSFRPGQEEIIDCVLAGGNGTLAVMATGSGKSALFQIPAVMSEDMTVVVSPLIALMKDQVDALKACGIRAEAVNSTMTPKQQKEAMDRVEKNEVDILYVAPERFSNQDFMSILLGVRIGLFAIDEAHCISSWGHDFRPSYSRLKETIKSLGPRSMLATTATATDRVRDDICRSLGMPDAKRFVRGVHRKNMAVDMRMVSDQKRNSAILDEIRKWGKGTTGIVYVTTRDGASALCDYLKGRGVEAIFYHGGMADKARKEIQEKWMKDGGLIVATSAFGMGIDRPDVRYVIYSGLTGSVEEWYQAVGRAGRDGRDCLCLSLYDLGGDYRIQSYLIELTNPKAEDVRSFWRWLLRVAEKSAAQGAKTVTVPMTQNEMASGSGVPNVGACMSALRSQGAVKTIGRGKYQVTLGASPDFQASEKLRMEKFERLNELCRFFKSGFCRFKYVCDYFGDETFGGECGKCDNCRKGKKDSF